MKLEPIPKDSWISLHGAKRTRRVVGAKPSNPASPTKPSRNACAKQPPGDSGDCPPNSASEFLLATRLHHRYPPALARENDLVIRHRIRIVVNRRRAQPGLLDHQQYNEFRVRIYTRPPAIAGVA